MDNPRVTVPLDRAGLPTGVFTCRIFEEHKEWEVSGTVGIGNTGIELRSLHIEPLDYQSPGNSSDLQSITSSTLKQLKISEVRGAIAEELERHADTFRRQDRMLQSLETLDDTWDRMDAARYAEAVGVALEGLTEYASAARRRSAAGGRPPVPEACWARRAEIALAALRKGGGNVYKQLSVALKAQPDTVPQWLKRMRRPPDSADLGTGWLRGTGTGTRRGPRLKAWRAAGREPKCEKHEPVDTPK